MQPSDLSQYPPVESRASPMKRGTAPKTPSRLQLQLWSLEILLSNGNANKGVKRKDDQGCDPGVTNRVQFSRLSKGQSWRCPVLKAAENMRGHVKVSVHPDITLRKARKWEKSCMHLLYMNGCPLGGHRVNHGNQRAKQDPRCPETHLRMLYTLTEHIRRIFC